MQGFVSLDSERLAFSEKAIDATSAGGEPTLGVDHGILSIEQDGRCHYRSASLKECEECPTCTGNKVNVPVQFHFNEVDDEYFMVAIGDDAVLPLLLKAFPSL